MDKPTLSIAFFCMEYMLSEALPIYAGGLGNVAGDVLKTASDMNLPMTGIGLLYQQGYFRQMIDLQGKQVAAYPSYSIAQMPLQPVLDQQGQPLRIQLDLVTKQIYLRVWQVQVGHVTLYLLDSNDAANAADLRQITNQLYGGDLANRCLQEIILGLGGWQLLATLNAIPHVCHLNEGHTAFAVLGRVHYYMQRTGQGFSDALAATRVANVFTTHTAVPAGFDRYPADLINQLLRAYVETTLKISMHDLLALGRANAHDNSEPFNMAYLAIRGSGVINGVSQLQSEISKDLFKPLFPKTAITKIPIIAVTNGVHMATWASQAAMQLWYDIGGSKYWEADANTLQQGIKKISAARLWTFRQSAREGLVTFLQKRMQVKLNPHAFTIGFARRFATYKRGYLLLQDEDKLIRLLNNPTRPVQLLLAGKAHPADAAGQAIIEKWIQFCQRPEVKDKVVFIPDYDIQIAQQLVQGVDLWLNTPRRPWEACGTSGMKVLVNGGINFSELDGWWAEAYRPEYGWALGDGQLHADETAWDQEEVKILYDILENEILMEFYWRDEHDIPQNWLQRVRASMFNLTPQFSAQRMLQDYIKLAYQPAAQAALLNPIES